MNEQLEDDNILCRLLPPSIASLQIYDTMGTPTLARLLKGLLRLVDAASQGQFPNLRRVRCYVREQLDDHGPVLKFASAGMYLDMVLGPPSDVVSHRRSSTMSSASVELMTDPLVM
ncbi:hypothetical protein F4859DRAFT_203638 [Xylaria cf. heliscus]|nr:hypothetical protein F4859DRAFT_203638 [Xylaria cf. heliscus]